MIWKLVHLVVFDILNIVFCALNHYSTGVYMHIGFLVLHTIAFSLDFLMRRGGKQFKKTNKYIASIAFDVIYYLSAYLCLMGFLVYFCSFIRNPKSIYFHSFPSECLGQSFPDPTPISSVCRRISPTNAYHYNTTT